MKSYKGLYEKMVSSGNISKCIDKASLGKRNRRDVKWVLNHKEEVILSIQESLEDYSFQLNMPKHKPFKINDGITRKVRYIVQPDFIEQILHHMLISVLSDIIMKGMYKYNCGSVPKRGGTYALRHVERFVRKHKNDGETNYCLKLDIHHFFQSIDHNKLKMLMFKHIKDQRVLDILCAVVDSYSDHEDEEHNKYGIPIGFYTSQWFANWFLQGLDHFIKQDLKVKFYNRYMDDMVIFNKSKKRLHEVYNRIAEYLQSINLSLNKKWQIFPFDKRIINKNKEYKGRCVNFVGYKIYRDRTLVRKNTLRRALRKIRRIHRRKRCNWYSATQALSFLGWVSQGTTKYLQRYKIENLVNIQFLRRTVSIHNKCAA